MEPELRVISDESPVEHFQELCLNSGEHIFGYTRTCNGVRQEALRTHNFRGTHCQGHASAILHLALRVSASLNVGTKPL